MDSGRDTERLLAELETLSGGRLQRRADLGVILELGSSPSSRDTLDGLAFSAKFLVRAQEMLRRIGPEGEGYGGLAAEFSAHTEKAVVLLRTLLEGAPPALRGDFDARYLSLTPGGMENLLGLFADLRWYKNWLIDSRSGGPGEAP